ncbi:MAG: peptide deformylase [Acidimicrobiales bacterium]
MSQAVSPFAIRIVGDPVLRQKTAEVTDIDGKLHKLVQDMFITMYEAPGIGLAAPQVGVQKRFFVYDLGDDAGQQVLINPVITGSDGEWTYDEGCLSVPGQYFEITRPKQIEVSGRDIDGNEVSFEADELLARLIQHELDHLDGVLLLDHLDDDQAKAAKKFVREMQMKRAEESGPAEGLGDAAPRKRLGLRLR